MFNYEYIDLAEILNISWNTAHGRFFYQTIVPNEYGLFVLHFEPIILLVSLFFVVFDHPISLYIAFNTLLAFAAFPFFLLAKHLLHDKTRALILSLAYLSYAPLKGMYILSDADPVLLTIPFIFCAFYFYEKKKTALCLMSLICSAFCKENAALTVACFGLYICCIRKNIRFGLILFIGGILYTFSIVKVIESSGIYAGESLYAFLKYNSFGENFQFIVFKPIAFICHAIGNNHIHFLGNLLKHFSFIPLLTPEYFISAASMLQVLLCKRPIEYGRLYYAAQTVPFMFVGVTYFIVRIKNIPWGPLGLKDGVCKIIPYFILTTCILSNFTENIYGYIRKDRLSDFKYANATNIYDTRFYTPSKRDEYISEVVSIIPRDAPVMVSANIAPLVADRKIVYYFPYPNADKVILLSGGYERAKFLSFLAKVDYLLIDIMYRGYGAGEYPYLKNGDLRDSLDLVLENTEWELIKNERDIIFLKRSGVY